MTRVLFSHYPTSLTLKTFLQVHAFSEPDINNHANTHIQKTRPRLYTGVRFRLQKAIDSWAVGHLRKVLLIRYSTIDFDSGSNIQYVTAKYSAVRYRGIGTSIAEANKKVPIFPMLPGEASKRVPLSTEKLRQGQDESLCLLLHQNPPLVYPIQMLSSHATFPSRVANLVSALRYCTTQFARGTVRMSLAPS